MLTKIKDYLRKNLIMTLFQAMTFGSILVLAIVYEQSPIQILPMFVSLVVMFLQARVNRYAFLVGGINSCLYAVAYILRTLYSSAAYALLVSFPLQILTFINWNKRTDKDTEERVTDLRLMSGKARLLWAVATVVGWGALYLIFSAFGSKYMLLDNTATLLGIVTTVLCAMCYIEYAPLQLISNVVTVILNASMIADAPENITWLINSVYGTVCTAVALYVMVKNYREKQTKAEKEVTIIQTKPINVGLNENIE